MTCQRGVCGRVRACARWPTYISAMHCGVSLSLCTIASSRRSHVDAHTRQPQPAEVLLLALPLRDALLLQVVELGEVEAERVEH